MWGAIIGAAVSLGSAYMSKKKSEKQSEVSTDNAAAMQKEAEYQRFRTSIQLGKHARAVRMLLGAQRAAYAKSGVQVDTGTALQMAESTAAEAAEDAALIRQEGDFNVQRALAGVNMYQQQASDIRQAGRVEAGTTLLTGAWDFAKNFMGSSSSGGSSYTGSEMNSMSWL